MWRGCGPTVVRAMILNTCQLASYSQAKEMLIQSGYFQDNIIAHSSASLISGFLSTCVSMPVDMAKTRMQTMAKVSLSLSLSLFLFCVRVCVSHALITIL